MNFLEMQDEVLNHGFDPSRYRTRVKRWLNEAQGRIASLLELPNLYTTYTLTTVQGTDTYPLSGVIRINGITNPTTPVELTYVDDPADVEYYNQAGAGLGEPQHYTLTSSGIRLSPVPDAAYNLILDYYKSPSSLTDDSQTSDISSDYHDIMISYALSRAYRSEDDPQMSQFFWAEFMRDLGFMGADRQAVVRDGPRQVPGMWNV